MGIGVVDPSRRTALGEELLNWKRLSSATIVAHERAPENVETGTGLIAPISKVGEEIFSENAKSGCFFFFVLIHGAKVRVERLVVKQLLFRLATFRSVVSDVVLEVIVEERFAIRGDER